MEEKYYTQEFDKELNKIDIYNRYPFLPFIGSKYAKSKILCLGESHFLPIHVTNKTPVDDSWYHKQLSDFILSDKEKIWLSTRIIIDEDVIKSDKQYKSHSIYINIGKEIGWFTKPKCSYNEALKAISFYNYFLRPTEKEGDSIINTKEDDEFAFKHLVKINDILKPNAIIFTSKKAWQAFDGLKIKNKENEDFFNTVKNKIFSVPHPGCAWWNRKSNSYKLEGLSPLTGKEKFDEIINKLIKDHPSK